MAKQSEPKIEKGITLPPPIHNGRGISKEATLMRAMKKGDSLLLNGKQKNIMALAWKHIGSGKYAIRNENGGFRVWRIK